MLADIELPGALCSRSPAYWADFSKIVLANGDVFNFKDREYQIEVMGSGSRVIVVEKATGLGFSEIFILRTLWGCIFGRYKQGVLYLFPNDDDMQEFSKSRFGPLIKSNRLTIGKYVKSAGVKSTDTAGLKRIGSSSLFMSGARLTQTVGGDVQQKESAALRSKQVDCVVCDERDLMDDDVEDKARGRMGNSEVKEEVYISNPTIPDIGIDKKYNESDQRMWFVRCGCGEWNCPDEVFPDYIGVGPDGRGHCVCRKCGKPLVPDNLFPLTMEDIKNGKSNRQWVAKRPDVKGIAGYRLSHLNSSKNDPYQILLKYRDLTDNGGNIADFYKLVLGLPYIAAEDKLQLNVVLGCCGQEIMPFSHNGPCAMGVDVGKIKHVVIGTRTGSERFEILKVAQVSGWNDIHDLAKRFNVRSAVLDIRPYEDEVRRFQKEERFRVFLCEYAESTALGTVYNDHTGIVKVNRTEIFDSTHRLFSKGLVKLPRECPDVKEFALQCCNTAKVLETNKKSGTSIYRYKKLGDEHYRNALNYFYLAASGNQVARVRSSYEVKRPEYVDNEYARI